MEHLLAEALLTSGQGKGRYYLKPLRTIVPPAAMRAYVRLVGRWVEAFSWEGDHVVADLGICQLV